MSNLGAMLVGQRKLDEGIQTLRDAVRLRPGHLDTHVELARALELAHRNQEAAEVFAAILKLSPDNQNVIFHLAALNGSGAPPAAPPALVAALFNRHADTFDAHLLEHLEYRVPRLLEAALVESQVGTDLDVLDLGCGTGLCGPLLRPMARSLAGVDLSAAMLEKAKERGVYDRLAVGEVVARLRAESAAYDLLVAGDVLCYLGDLSETLCGAARALRPGGYFAFSVEFNEGPGWVLRPSRRYAHSPDYIRQTADAHGLDVIHLAIAMLRREAGKDLSGIIAVLRRPAGAQP
jgi:predicted TPR repeat methyltransferase